MHVLARRTPVYDSTSLDNVSKFRDAPDEPVQNATTQEPPLENFGNICRCFARLKSLSLHVCPRITMRYFSYGQCFLRRDQQERHGVDSEDFTETTRRNAKRSRGQRRVQLPQSSVIVMSAVPRRVQTSSVVSSEIGM